MTLPNEVKDAADTFYKKYNVPPVRSGMTVADHAERAMALQKAYAALAADKANEPTTYPCPNCQGCGCPTCNGYGTLTY